MPSVIDTPELDNEMAYVETHDLTIEETLERERPQPCRVRPGFWPTLAHKIVRYLAPTSPAWHEGAYQVSRPYEAPMDRLARENPLLAAYALAFI
jgi:hypothetical protein